jgi:hypothetical protein
VLNDLSPAATFIAYNYNTPLDVSEFEREAKRILKAVEDECGWMFATIKTNQKGHNDLVYTCKNKLNIVNSVLFLTKGVYNGKKSTNTLLFRE